MFAQVDSPINYSKPGSGGNSGGSGGTKPPSGGSDSKPKPSDEEPPKPPRGQEVRGWDSRESGVATATGQGPGQRAAQGAV
ncbi:hypothetical protein LTR51_002800 [Lithohypha guttulata]|nr:hypothetical protein LTR51_002800 [Lithohypha guttulata]